MGPIMAGLGGRGMRRSIPVFGGLKSSAERTPSESSGLRLIGVHVKMHIFGVPTLVRQIPSQMPPSLVQPVGVWLRPWRDGTSCIVVCGVVSMEFLKVR